MAATLLSPLPEQADDDALMRRVAARDAQAFAVLAGRHAGRPHRIAWRMLGDAAEAEDVAQEAFCRLVQQGRKPCDSFTKEGVCEELLLFFVSLRIFKGRRGETMSKNGTLN